LDTGALTARFRGSSRSTVSRYQLASSAMVTAPS
jgi:hypothetical protein